MLWLQVLIAAGLLHLVARRSRPASIAFAILIFVPIGDGNSLATAMRGLWGDPSVTTVQLLALALLGRTSTALRENWRLPLAIALAAVILYASALGPWNFDLYRFGYQPAWLVALLSLAALTLWWRGQPLCLWLLAVDLLAWHMGWLESTNLWDTLLDPLLMIVMLALALRNGYRARRHQDLSTEP